MKTPTESRFAHDSVGGDVTGAYLLNLGTTPYLEAWEVQRLAGQERSPRE